MNASINAGTGKTPFEVIYGRKSQIHLPILNPVRSKTPAEHQLKTKQALEDIHKFVQIASTTTDQKHLAQSNDGQLRRPLEKGDICCLYRPVAAAAGKKEPWIGEYKVIETNNYVLKIENVETKETDWVSLHHVRRIKERPERLQTDLRFQEPVIVPIEHNNQKEPLPHAEIKGGAGESVISPSPIHTPSKLQSPQKSKPRAGAWLEEASFDQSKFEVFW